MLSMGWMPFFHATIGFSQRDAHQLSMNRKTIFCHDLTDWLHEEEWHFTTLLAVTIGCSENLPEDTDSLIHQLLMDFPSRPAKETIVQFLSSSPQIKTWFRRKQQKPRVVRFCLQAPKPLQLSERYLPRLYTLADLAQWLNTSHHQLDWLADLKRYDRTAPSLFNHYHYSFIQKRDGRQRLLESPKNRLKAIQRKINNEILPFVAIHDGAHGFRKGRSCKSHAEIHAGKHYVFLFDLAHCFQSIGWKSVYSQFLRLGYTARVTRYLTALCTHAGYPDHELLAQLDSEQRLLLLQRHLPQGAPTSPTLSNGALFTLDKRLAGLSKSLGLEYSRYADDLAFSGDNLRDWQFFEPLVGAICLEQGFSLNHRKSRLLRQHQKQKITGIVVNEKPNIDRRYYDQLKATLTNCSRHGLVSQNRSNHPDFRAYLQGSVQHVKTLNEDKGRRLEALLRQISWPHDTRG